MRERVERQTPGALGGAVAQGPRRQAVGALVYGQADDDGGQHQAQGDQEAAQVAAE